jgi:acyl-CoA hydrolase
MMDQSWRTKATSADEVAAYVKSGQRVFVHGAAATPTPLLEALGRRGDLENVQLYHLHLAGDEALAAPEQRGRLFSNSLFVGAGLRRPIDEGRADFLPVFLSDIPRLFTSRRIPLDVAIVQLSPPDRHGLCTLGPSVDTALAAVESARIVIAEINDRMPRTGGHSAVRFDKVTAFITTNRPLHEAVPPPITEVEGRIGDHIAALVEDGSTLQLGIGAIPDAVLARLGNKRDLGLHTEMFSDRVIDLLEGGVITNRFKKVHQGRSVTSFVSGTQRLFDFVDDNRAVEFHPCDRTNDVALIRQNPKVVAINSAIEVDLTGQVCADSIGHRIFSGIGGQMDFIHGAALSEGGRPIIALPSTASGGRVSRITAALKPGAGVVTTRGHVHWVITEYGAVDLFGMTLRQRAEALISIAHPDVRGTLGREVSELRHFPLPSG